MIRTLLTTTGVALLLSTAAYAQNATNAPAAASGSLLTNGYVSTDSDFLASRIIGQPIYTSTAADSENIGNVNDIVLDPNGGIAAVIVGVGGFLGIGEKNVAVDYEELEMAIAADNTERWVLKTTKEALNAAPAFEWTDDEPMDTAAMAPADQPNTMAPADQNAMAPSTDTAAAQNATPTDQNATAPSTDTAAVPNTMTADPVQQNMSAATETAANPAVTTYDSTRLNAMAPETITADNLKGTRVIGPENEQIAEVGDVLLTPEGQIDAILVDFGGFLGIGEKRVAVGTEGLDFRMDENNNRYVWLNVTREQLDAAPAYDEANYQAQRDTQRLVINPA